MNRSPLLGEQVMPSSMDAPSRDSIQMFLIHGMLTALNFYSVKWAYTSDLTAWQLTFFRSLICTLIAAYFKPSVSLNQRPLVIARSMLGSTSILTLYFLFTIYDASVVTISTLFTPMIILMIAQFVL